MKKNPPKIGEAKWLTLAYQEVEVKEIPGPEHNSRILEYHKAVTKNYTRDEISWCSSFINWCFLQCGLEGTRSAVARSWMSWGIGVEKPYRGCVAVFWRGQKDGWKGHVGFYVGEQGGNILVLGGNQDDMVCIMKYPKSQLLGFRKPGSELPV